jgi:hypothetical protein
MLKKVLALSFIILAGCSNPPAPKENVVKPDTHKKAKVATVKPATSYWTVNSFAPRDGQTEGRKFVKFATEGTFSDSTQANRYLYAEVFVDKKSAGIFLHKLKKNSAIEKFDGPVQIKVTNSSGSEIKMTSGRRWNNSGGSLIENNNNDYSQFRIFLLQNTGVVNVEMKDSKANTYQFSLYLDGFSDSFSKL